MDTPVMPEIRYFTPDFAGAEHLRVFHCEKLHATLSPEACARRWVKAAYPCGGCPIGKVHADQLGLRRQAGQTRTPMPMPCCRCGRREFRLVSGTLCISCFNRQAEWVRGRNAKGNPPTIALHRFEVLVIALDGLGTRPRAGGATVEVLGLGEYAIRLIALDEAEVRRTCATLWPDAKIIAVGLAAAPAGQAT